MENTSSIGNDNNAIAAGRENGPDENTELSGKTARNVDGPETARNRRHDRVATDGDEGVTGLHKAEFLDRVSSASNVSRAQARRVVEATLSELGRALSGDEPVVLPPLGTARVRRRRAMRDGEVVLIRLRRNTVPADRRHTPPGE